jgi:hypothetical protein
LKERRAWLDRKSRNLLLFDCAQTQTAHDPHVEQFTMRRFLVSSLLLHICALVDPSRKSTGWFVVVLGDPLCFKKRANKISHSAVSSDKKGTVWYSVALRPLALTDQNIETEN